MISFRELAKQLKMFKSKKLITYIAVIIAIVGVYNYLQSKPRVEKTPNEKVVRDFKANLVINDGVNTFIFDAEPFVGKSALEATKVLTDNRVVFLGTGKDTFISEINGKKIDPSKREFWELFVNGISSKISAEKYIIQKGDQIEWHINLHS